MEASEQPCKLFRMRNIILYIILHLLIFATVLRC